MIEKNNQSYSSDEEVQYKKKPIIKKTPAPKRPTRVKKELQQIKDSINEIKKNNKVRAKQPDPEPEPEEPEE